ncbi:MAG: hypothetical protein ACTHJ1_17630 [Bordetella sp.]|uniref:hypothetical protein n=1 Tax=Bordetella sp. TaxID=28081 RepID=UPI003F7C7ACB
MKLFSTAWVMAAAMTGALIATTPARAQSAPSTQLRGTISSVSPHAMTLKTTGGDKPVAVALPAHVRLLSVSRASLAGIKPDSYIGTAATRRQDGTLEALEVHIFAPGMRGVGAGFRPWRGAGGATGTMTNGTAGSLDKGLAGSMVNGSVSASTGLGAGATLVVDYPGGRQTVDVSPDVPVVYMEPGKRSLLKRGTAVLVFAARDRSGGWTARTVIAGKDGVVPPM